MITDNERRDVARKLRELADYCDENEMSLTDDDWPGILSDYIWPEDSGYHIYDEDCRRLADLIEPMRTDEETGDSWGQIYDDMCPRDDGMTFEEFESRCKALGEGK